MLVLRVNKVSNCAMFFLSIYKKICDLSVVCPCTHAAHSSGPGEQRHRFWDGGRPEGRQSSQKTGYDLCVHHSTVIHPSISYITVDAECLYSDFTFNKDH